MTSASSSKLIIDTDAGVDDAYALLLALGTVSRPVDLITCSHGNCSVSSVKVNVAKCCKLMKQFSNCKTMPSIVVGAQGPLTDTPIIEASYFHGVDGMGDVASTDPGAVLLDEDELEEFITSTIPTSTASAVSSTTNAAAAAIINICKESLSSSVDIICLGPLTNLAVAFHKGGDMLKDKIKNVYIMGGSEFLGNVTRVAEFNIYADPEAASVVFETLGSPEWAANTKTTVFGWNLCIQSPIPWPRFDQIIYDENNPHKIRQFLSAISQKPYPPLSSRPADKKRGGKGAVICDALVMVAALYPNLILETEKVHVEVELSGEMTRGQTILDYGHCYDGIERPKLIDWVTKVDTETYISLLEILVKGGV